MKAYLYSFKTIKMCIGLTCTTHLYKLSFLEAFVQVRSIKSVQVITTKFEKDFVQVITCTTQPYKLQLVQDFVQVITCTKSQLVHDIYNTENKLYILKLNGFERFPGKLFTSTIVKRDISYTSISTQNVIYRKKA